MKLIVHPEAAQKSLLHHILVNSLIGWEQFWLMQDRMNEQMNNEENSSNVAYVSTVLRDLDPQFCDCTEYNTTFNSMTNSNNNNNTVISH